MYSAQWIGQGRHIVWSLYLVDLNPIGFYPWEVHMFQKGKEGYNLERRVVWTRVHIVTCESIPQRCQFLGNTFVWQPAEWSLAEQPLINTFPSVKNRCQRLGKPLFLQQRETRLHDSRKNEMFNWVFSRWYTKSYLKGVTEWLGGFVCQEAGQYGTRTSTERVQKRKSTGQGMTEEDRYWDIADRQNIKGERITEKNPRDRIQDREDKVFSLSGVSLCNK
jgi:hypothetical protein